MTRQDWIECWKFDVANEDYLGGLAQYIDENEEEDEQHELPYDTPSLDTSFHDHEMAV